MDVKSLQLQLISHILQTQDLQVLQTLAGILDLKTPPPAEPNEFTSHSPFFPPIATSAPASEPVRDIQNEIDQLFTL